MSAKSPQEQATLGFALLMGYSLFALGVQCLYLLIGPMTWTSSPELGVAVTSIQIAGLCLVYQWSKQHKAAGPLAILGVAGVLFLFSSLVRHLAHRPNEMITLLFSVTFIICVVCLFTWLHRLYLSLDRDDLLRLQRWVMYLFVLSVVVHLFPPSVRAGLPTLFSGLFVGYFAYVFFELRKETLKSDS